jgi:nucleotide-binding universal stress UspA family protein
MSYKRIIVPVDGSPTSNRGMQEAIRIARGSKSARLLLLHVVEEFAALSSPDIGVDIGPVLEAMRAGGRKTLAGIARRARGARAETLLVENLGARVADVIVEQARRWRADLIVMGTHGRRGLRRALMGSDAELVARHSSVPVLLVPARGRGTAGKR